MSPMKFLSLLLIVAISSCQQFNFTSSPSRSPGLQVDRIGRIYASAGSQLYRLSGNLQLEETRDLSSEAANISLSSDGRWLVVCLTDLSCEVYNATNFSAGHVFRRENVIISVDNFALFATEDSFYVGGVTTDAMGNQDQIILRRYGFVGSQVGVEVSGSYDISETGPFIRNFYGGFVRGSNAYFFVIDNNPSTLRSVRVMRVCHNSDFNALYEFTLTCGQAPSIDARIGGLSVAENFAGTTGATVILSRSRQRSSLQNFICLFDLNMIDNIMQQKFDTCTASRDTFTGEVIDLAWRNTATSCLFFLPTQDSCQFNIAPPRALDDIDNLELAVNVRINLGASNQNFITASVVVTVGNFSFVFAAYTSNTGNHFITGFDIGGTSGTLFEINGFDMRAISDGPVTQLQWTAEMNFISAITATSVIQIPIANCSSHSDCTSCLDNGNPLCGWCVVENKCSQESECQNPETRWIRATGTNANQCPTLSVTPQQFDLDNPELLTLTLSQSLPPLLVGETYLCHFASGGITFTVDAMGSGTTYTCNVAGRIPSELEGLRKVIDVSLASSQIQMPFSTNPSALTIYQCSATSSCSQCLQTNNACGWCVYNKVCSGISASCINGTDSFLQLSMNQNYTDVCPLLDRPIGGQNYLQPVQVNRNIELVTRNLPAAISGFNYMCSVNGISLPATYNNDSSLTCLVNAGQLTLPSGTGQQEVDLAIRWVGQTSEGRNINHPIDAIMPTNVLLYNCPELTDGCSSCLGLSIADGFECGWCDRPNGMTDTCSFVGDCPVQNLATAGSQCPFPSITDFSPMSGPPEGGTTITIVGRELGVTFDDFTANSIMIVVEGQTGVPCMPTDHESYVPGREIRCITTAGGTIGSNAIRISLPSRSGQSTNQFRVVSPQITRVVPSRGPQTGGTRLTVYGSDLNIGNIDDTRITVTSGTECTVDQASIQASNITCTTLAFTNPATGPVMVMIDRATISNNDVQFTYTSNPEFYSVTPTNTILGGGIELIFNGTNLDVVQNPMLVISDPQYLDISNSTLCMVINSSSLSCVTPPLTRIQSGDSDGVNYTIRVDNAPGPDLTIESLQISVWPNPGNFILVDSIYTTQDIETRSPIRIRGDNLNSLSGDFYTIAIGGGSCTITFITDTEINCIPPPDPTGGITEAIVTVSVGAYLVYTLDSKLVYGDGQSQSNLSTIIPAILVPLLVVIVAIATLIIGLFYFYVIRTKRKFEIVDEGVQGESKANTLAMSSLVQSSNLQAMHEELIKQVPKKFVIPSSQLHLAHNHTIGQGEFGIVYKAQLINWQGRRLPLPVAVKTLKGLFSASDVESMLAEITKMKDLHHLNVMSLIGVCLDAGPGVSIVMPFMANGSLLDYLKKERATLYLPDTSELEDVLSVRKLLLRMCHQIAKGMEYLALNKFVHRDLAARNCMLDSSGNIRVGDFGLAEDVYTRGYFRQGKDDAVKLPFKWMAPESLRDGLFSEKSDVWSFGITCWEIFSAGRIPYPGVDAMRMLKILENRTRLEKPDNAACAPEIYSTVKKCWAPTPEDRPNFKQLQDKVGKLLSLVADYMELNMELLPKEEGEEESGYEIVYNPVVEEYEAVDEINATSGANSGYKMTDNSAYRVGTQSITCEEKRSDNGGDDATMNIDMTSNTAYASNK